MVKIYKQPFAHEGDTIDIPEASQPDGKMSNVDGWTPDYQLPKTDPNYKPVGRQEMNGVFKEVTGALGQVQQFGFADWQNITGGWPIGANVRHTDGYWQSLANGNTEEPGTGALWKELLFSNLVPASETIQGLARLATAAEAQALTADDVAITPETLGDALNAHALGMGQTWRNVVTSRSAGTVYTNTTGRTIAVSINSSPATSGKTQLDLYINEAYASRTSVPGSGEGAGDGTNAWMTFIIPPGDTYMVSSPAGSISRWWELR